MYVTNESLAAKVGARGSRRSDGREHDHAEEGRGVAGAEEFDCQADGRRGGGEVAEPDAGASLAAEAERANVVLLELA